MINFNYFSAGNRTNPPVIFLHGFLGSARDWQNIISDLSADYYCLALDLPGHGKTGFPDISEELFLEQFASELIDFIKNQRIITPWVIGYSMGGRLAIPLMFEKNKFWKGFVLESASPGIEDEQERADRLAHDYNLADELATTDLTLFLQKWYDQPIFDSVRNTAGFSQVFMERLKNKPDQLARALRSMTVARQKSFWQDFRNITKPLLLISGCLDEKYTSINRRIASLCSMADLEIVDDAGHNVHIEQPEKYTRIIRSFFDQHS